jgi:DNA mismatch repair protein MutL
MVPIEQAFSIGELTGTFSGFIGKAHHSRPNRTGQYLFINKRPIFSLALSFGVKDGYGTAMEPLRHPAFVLALTVPSNSVDVNVHPQKREVRFAHEEELKQQVAQAVTQTLFPSTQVALSSFLPQPMVAMAVHKKQEHVQPFYLKPAPVAVSPIVVEPSKPVQELFQEKKIRFSVIGIFQEFIFVHIETPQLLPEQLRKEGIHIVHAKHALARIAYEELEKNEQKRDVHSQQLLTPIFMELTQVEAMQLVRQLPLLQQLGFDIREFGKMAFLIEAIPATLAIGAVTECINEFVQEENDPTKLKRRIAKMASLSAQRAKEQLTMESARETIKRLFTAQDPYTCPFGQPTIWPFSREEMEKHFL